MAIGKCSVNMSCCCCCCYKAQSEVKDFSWGGLFFLNQLREERKTMRTLRTANHLEAGSVLEWSFWSK